MNEFRWSHQLIMELIKRYQRHDILYNTKHPFYCDRMRRVKTLYDLCQELKEFKKEITVEHIRLKVKTLRTQFVKELRKVNRSKQIGTGRDDVYIPKLWCYEELEFLRNHCELKEGKPLAGSEIGESKSNISTDFMETYEKPLYDRSSFEVIGSAKKYQKDPISIVENADYENEPDHNYVSKDFQSAEDTRPSTSSPFVPNECGSKPTQIRKQRKLAPYYSMLSAAVKSLTEDNQSTPPDETIYSAFGKSIALQLTQLSSVEAASTISEIQQLMSKNIITSMMSKERGEQDTKFTLPQTNPVDKGNSHLRTHSNDYYSLTM